MVGWLGLPQAAIMASPTMGRRQDIAGTQPFTWGAGGAMLTPEDLARQREISDSRSQANFSPVGSVWEGLGRVSENVFGALDSRKLDKNATAASEHSRAILAALRDPAKADPTAVVTALTDPYTSEAVRSLAGKVWDRQNPKPVNNDTSADAMLYDQRLGAGKGDEFLRNKLDPIVTIPTPFGPYVGRESAYAATMAQFQGGGQPQGGTAQPPATLPPDFDFGQGGQTPPASGGFRGGFFGLPGETVTSTYRDPAHNARVGGVTNSFHTRRDAKGRPMARDSVPPPGMSMAAYAALLRKQNPHLQVINEGDHVHMEPK